MSVLLFRRHHLSMRQQIQCMSKQLQQESCSFRNTIHVVLGVYFSPPLVSCFLFFFHNHDKHLNFIQGILMIWNKVLEARVQKAEHRAVFQTLGIWPTLRLVGPKNMPHDICLAWDVHTLLLACAFTFTSTFIPLPLTHVYRSVLAETFSCTPALWPALDFKRSKGVVATACWKLLTLLEFWPLGHGQKGHRQNARAACTLSLHKRKQAKPENVFFTNEVPKNDSALLSVNCNLRLSCVPATTARAKNAPSGCAEMDTEKATCPYGMSSQAGLPQSRGAASPQADTRRLPSNALGCREGPSGSAEFPCFSLEATSVEGLQHSPAEFPVDFQVSKR